MITDSSQPSRAHANPATGVPTIGVPKEVREGEARVAATPDTVKKLCKKGFSVKIEKSAGVASGFPDDDFRASGEAGQVEIVSASQALGCDVVLKIHRPTESEVSQLKQGSLLISMMEPYRQEVREGLIEKLAQSGVNCIALELIPRTSRAQSMDVLSSQANIAGYRAVLEGASRYCRFFPMMMTSAGSAKPAKVIVLGAGVAGLQAIGTARRLGAQVEAYDVRPEVKEQILSLGAKFIEFDIGEEGTGQGGYAKELSEAAKARQQQLLTEKLKKADVIVSTANIPGRKSPILITEEAVRGMRPGSVVVDLAAANGGNCPLTEAERIVTKYGVVLVGLTNYPALMPSDSSSFFARNIWNLMSLMWDTKEGATGASIQLNLEDDIIAAALITHQGQVRMQKK